MELLAMNMLPIDVISRIVHVGTAIALVGGSTFMFFVLMPAASELDESTHDKLVSSVLSRWKRIVHIGIALFLVSGIYNYVRAIPNHDGDSLYHALVGSKMILALVVFFIASALVGRASAFQKMRDNRRGWLRVLLLLAAIVVGISGFVKVRGTAETPQVNSSDSP